MELVSKKLELVNSPDHYTRYKFEVIDIIDEVAPYYDSLVSGHIQNVIKYLFRAPHKSDLLLDLKKAEYYLNHAINLLEDEEEIVLDEY